MDQVGLCSNVCTQGLFLAQFLGNGSEEYHSNYNLHKHFYLPSLRWTMLPAPLGPWGAKCPSQATAAPQLGSSGAITSLIMRSSPLYAVSEPWKSLIVQPEMCYVYSSLENCQSPCFWRTHGLRLHKIWKLLHNSWGNTAETAGVTLGTVTKIKKALQMEPG